MAPLESLVSNATVCSVTLESSITILEAPFTLIYDVYSTDVNGRGSAVNRTLDGSTYPG